MVKIKKNSLFEDLTTQMVHKGEYNLSNGMFQSQTGL